MSKKSVSQLSAAAKRLRSIRKLYGEFEASLRTTLSKAVAIGGLLHEQKRAMPHGEFSRWLESSIDFSARSARRFMQLYSNRDRLGPATSINDACLLVADTDDENGHDGHFDDTLPTTDSPRIVTVLHTESQTADSPRTITGMSYTSEPEQPTDALAATKAARKHLENIWPLDLYRQAALAVVLRSTSQIEEGKQATAGFDTAYRNAEAAIRELQSIDSDSKNFGSAIHAFQKWLDSQMKTAHKDVQYPMPAA